jgi:hypothetical protein
MVKNLLSRPSTKSLLKSGAVGIPSNTPLFDFSNYRNYRMLSAQMADTTATVALPKVFIQPSVT